jgi:elongation factor Ts
MTTITSAIIKDLREATGAGMMDCKKALEENNGDFEASKDWLRTKGIASAGKKAGRIAAEGLIGIAASAGKAAIIELNSETDFVAKNEQFQKLVTAIATAALDVNGDFDKLSAYQCAKTGEKVADHITNATATIGEKLSLRRSAALSVNPGVVATYIHNAYAPNLGKIGVLVALKSSGNAEQLAVLGKQIAMHIAAAKPLALTRAEVSAENIERERAIFSEQAKASGKPDNIIDKMVEGRIAKFYGEVVLPEQLFVIDNKTKVADVLKAAEKDVGAPIEIAGFIQFAEEVRKTAGVA